MTGLVPSDTHRAALARLAYDPARVPQWPLGARTLPRCFLDRDQDGMAVITIEGTRPDFLGDWRADLDQLDLVIDPTCAAVPHGWGALMLGVIFRILRDVTDPDIVLGWNGHSMGASNALIGAWLWKLAGRKLGRVTAWEPGPVGPLANMLAGESVLITWVGDPQDKVRRDPVPEATPRGHPAPVTWLPPQPRWSVIDMHEMVNVTAAAAAMLEGAPS
jgi:hypothetical protein